MKREPRLMGVRVSESVDRGTDYSTIRIERRVAQMIRQVAVAEKRGKAITTLLERMLRIYVESEHPEMVLVYEPDATDDKQVLLPYDGEAKP